LIDRIDMNSLAVLATRVHGFFTGMPDAVNFAVAKSTELSRARSIAVIELIGIVVLVGLCLALRRYKTIRRVR
jgi:hypothetical protein